MGYSLDGGVVLKINELQVDKLNSVLELTDSIINKKYLSFLSNAEVYPVRDLTMNELAIDINKHCRIFHLKKFIYDTNENFLHKLITVVNVAYALRGTVVTAIQSKGDAIDFYIGIVAKEKKGGSGIKDRNALLNAFEGTITGNFGGSDISTNAEVTKSFSDAVNGKAICSVSVVPSLRNNDESGILSYVQGIENLTDSLKGNNYTLLTVADPVSASDIAEIRHGYENIYNYLVPLYKVVETKGISETVNLSETDTENYVKGITEGISRTQSKSGSVSYSNGFNLGVSFIVSAGFNHSKSKGTTTSDSLSTSNTTSQQFGTAHARTLSAGNTVSGSTQVSIENRIIKSMLDKIEKNIERINECEGYGAFNSATYVLAGDRETALNVAGNFISLMKGGRSSSQISGINCWEEPGDIPKYTAGKSEKTFANLLSCLKHFTHPSFKVNNNVEVSASTMVSGPELSVQLGFPKKSVNGVVVMQMNPFGRNVKPYNEESVTCGNLYFMGRTEPQMVNIDLNSLSSHTFVTGSTGTGKSNVIYGILSKVLKKGVHFMVIEPAKGEYKNVFGKLESVRVLGTNSKKTEVLRINPFAFNDDVHVLEHIDRLIEVFNVCWAMYAAMPAVLKEAVEDAYLSCGWDLDKSVNKYGNNVYPAFTDLENSLVKIIDGSAYDDEVKSNYKGSLLTRTRSLANGINGRILCSNEIPEEELFDENVIIDLSRIGAADTKSLIMGILVIRLQEYRMSKQAANARLEHITVLEEAHNLLKKTSTEQVSEGSNIVGKSVEMLSNAIAEMRTYGEGFIIADQAPGLMDTSVIRNTNTKIILRTPEYNDRVLAGKAAGLSDRQIDEVARLPLGVAAVYQNGWLEPVLCRFEKYEYNPEYKYTIQLQEPDSGAEGDVTSARAELIKWMLQHRISKKSVPDFSVIEENINQLYISSFIKARIKQALVNESLRERAWKEYKFDTLADMVVDVIGCKKALVHLLKDIHSVEEIQDIMCRLQKTALGNQLSNELEMEINHCFMKVFSKEGVNELKQYYEWDYYSRHFLV